MKDTKTCTHRSFLQMYKLTNTSKRIWGENGVDFGCSKCKKQCHIQWKPTEEFSKKSGIKKILSCSAWMLPGILLILGLGFYYYWLFCSIQLYSALHVIGPAIFSIFLISIFHFGAMYMIIKSDRFEITEK